MKQGGVVNLVKHAIELKVPADAIPDAIEVDIAGMEIGDVRHLSDIKLPRGAKLSSPSEDDFTVLTIAPPVKEVVEDEPEVAADAVPSEEGDAEADAGEGDKGDAKDEKKDD